MKLTLPYGRKSVTGQLPDNWIVEEINPNKKSPLESPAQRLAEFLNSPINCKPFDEIFSAKKNVVIIAPDKTRKSGVNTLLPPILERLEKLGLGADLVTIIFATGIHPAQTEEQRRAIVGDEVFERYKCIDHDPRAEMEKAGEIKGRPLLINKTVTNADGLIVMGAVKLHYLAGFGGGRKAIMPGVASLDDCVRFHSLCLDPKGNGRHPSAQSGVLHENPLHEYATEAARAAGVDFMINTVVDESKNIIFLNAGDIEKSFADACKFAGDYQMVPVMEKAGVVIGSCGGYPADLNFIQAHKSLDSVYQAVKPGGVLFLVSECADGIGNEDFLRWFDHISLERMERALRENFVINGYTAYATREKATGCRVVLLSGLDQADVKKMGMTAVNSLENGIQLCTELAGSAETKAYVIKQAGLLSALRYRVKDDRCGGADV